MKPITIIAVVALIALSAITGYVVFSGIDVVEQFSLGGEPVDGVPETSASAITYPPPSMEGINIHNDVFGTGADPNIITLGPKTGGCEGCPPYPDKTSMEF